MSIMIPFLLLALTLRLQFSGVTGQEMLRCYSCSTADVSEIVRGVQDDGWRRWLTQDTHMPPKTPRCSQMLPGLALRSGVQSEPCPNGVCMKMWYRETGGVAQTWRTCIAGGQQAIRSDCTRISSGDGDMEVCTCASHLCNGSMAAVPVSLAIILLTTVAAMMI